MKVLVAEDDVNILDGIVELLCNEGYEVLAVENGRLAIENYSNSKPDFIILDIMMPELSGYEVCKEIRRQDSKTPILFLSAKSEEVDKVIGLELGADDFVSKPFGSRELLARVRAVHRRVLSNELNQEIEEIFSMGDLEISPLKLRAKKGKIEIELGPRDLQILKLLYQKKGEVVSRKVLFNKCWGEDFIGTTRTLDQHVSQLRKKIETDPKNPNIISTVHGVGYRYQD